MWFKYFTLVKHCSKLIKQFLKGFKMTHTRNEKIAKAIISDFFEFAKLHKHSLQGLSVEGTIDKYLKNNRILEGQ